MKGETRFPKDNEIANPQTESETSALYSVLPRVAGVYICLSGFFNIIGWLFNIPLLRSYLPGFVQFLVPVPMAFMFFFMGIALFTVIDGLYCQRAPWVSVLKYFSLAFMGGFSLYILASYWVISNFSIFEMWMNEVPSISTPLNPALCVFILFASLLTLSKRKYSEFYVVYLVCVPVMLVLQLAFYALVGYFLDIPVLFNFKMAFPGILCFILASITIQIGSIPFHGLYEPFRVKYTQGKWFAIASIILDFCVLIAAITWISEIRRLQVGALDESFYRLYLSIEFIAAFISMLIGIVILRGVYFFNRSLLLAQKEAEVVLQLKEQTKQLEEAKQTAEFANEQKSKVLSFISHDLKTPLNSIIGYSEMLEGGLTGKLTDKQQKYAHNIAISGHHMLNLVTEILDKATSEAGCLQSTPEWIDLASFINEIRTLVQPQAEEKHVSLYFKVAKDATGLKADPAQFKQITLNVLGNAIKYNKENGKVVLSFHLSEDRRHVIYRIMDTGIGIPQQDLPHIFEEFYRVKSGNAKDNGTGLGLPFAKKLVELHKGSITVDSEVGVGSTFTITLPLYSAVSHVPEEVLG